MVRAAFVVRAAIRNMNELALYSAIQRSAFIGAIMCMMHKILLAVGISYNYMRTAHPDSARLTYGMQSRWRMDIIHKYSLLQLNTELVVSVRTATSMPSSMYA